MGRIKGTLVKRTTMALMAKYKNQFTIDFETNKKVINSVMPDLQKKIRNSVAGFITRKIKREEKKIKSNFILRR
ncbi:MAG: 30S ribosomal protein S17e [Candidatus Pacearchaeota archaeon]